MSIQKANIVAASFLGFVTCACTGQECGPMAE
jgi:hypothetical protein